MKALATAALALATLCSLAPAEPPLVSITPAGQLTYAPDPLGNTIPDFANCGYEGGGVPLPNVPTLLTLTPNPTGDDTARIQAAIDQLAALPLQPNHYRGALLLSPGDYRIATSLKISTSGIVIRGQGKSSRLIATGKAKRNLFNITGQPLKESAQPTPILDPYVPVGAHSFTVANPAAFKVGQPVLVTRTGNQAWISFIAMDRITPRPTKDGEDSGTKQWTPFDLKFDRTITAIEANRITLDAPLTCAIETRWGGGSLAAITDPRLEHVGLENLSTVSTFDPSIKAKDHGTDYFADEDHALYAAEFTHARNCFVRNLTATGFYHGPVNAAAGAKNITIQDCDSLAPVSQLTGGRRYPYAIQGGQLILFNRCHSVDDRHAFVVGARVPGPNVFLDCNSENAHATSEPHHRWSVGGLYDNVHADMAVQDRQYMGTGHGWAGANYVIWNCEGSLVLQSPPTAQNWSIGFVGKRGKPAFPRPEGIWQSEGVHVLPRSLYQAQLAARLGPASLSALTPSAP